MNLTESFANWLEDQSVATLGQDLFISRARSKPSTQYWLIAQGGNSGPKNVNHGGLATHSIAVYYRNTNPQDVYDRLHELEEMVLTEGCLELEDFTVVSIETVGPFADQDLDNQDRTVGLLQITITTYQEA